MPDVYRCPLPPFYLYIFKYLTEAVEKKYDFSKLLLGIPRGFAKTTFIQLFTVWCILFSTRRFFLVCCLTARMATNWMSTVFDILSSPNMVRLFGNWRDGCQVDRQEEKEFTFRGRFIKMAGIGSGQSPRGFVRNARRPDIHIFDDIQDEKDAESEQLSEDLEKWFDGTVANTHDPTGCLSLFAGNLYNRPFCLLEKLHNREEWVSFVTGCLLADGKSLWEGVYPTERLLQRYRTAVANGTTAIFMAEMMNQKTAYNSMGLDASKLKSSGFDLSHSEGNYVIIDPAGMKKGSDDSCVGVCSVFDQTPEAVALTSKVMTPRQTINTVIKYIHSHNCSLVAIEGTAYQSTLGFWLKEAFESLEIEGVQIVEIATHGVPKVARIQKGLQSAQAGEFWIASDIIPLVVNQGLNFDPAKKDNKDDILDFIAYVLPVYQAHKDKIRYTQLDYYGKPIQIGNASQTCGF